MDLAERVDGWSAVPGIQMLLEQGYWQSKLYVETWFICEQSDR